MNKLGENPKEEGVKYDSDKAPIGLISPEFIFGLADVLLYGAKKYAPRNWEKGMDHSRLYDAAQRHLWTYWNLEDIDHESGKHHLLHAACCIMFLYVLKIRGKGKDDRPTT